MSDGPKVIRARGELEASESLGRAAERLEAHPAALQLRTLSTLAEIAVERNSTIVFPLPFEVMRVFEAMAHRLETSSARTPPRNGPTVTIAVPQGESTEESRAPGLDEGNFVATDITAEASS